MTQGFLLLSLMTLLSDRPADVTPHNAGVARELLGLEQMLAATLRTRDRAEMERLLDDEFVLRSEPDISRVTWIQNALTRCWGDRFQITGFAADVHEGVGIATFELTLPVNPATCQPATIRSLITDVWVQRDGAWRLRVRHSGPPVAASSGVAGQYALLPQRPPTWKLDSELSFVGTGGNTSTQTLGLASNLLHQAKGATSRVQVSFVTSEADKVTRARATDVQARHGVDVRNGLGVFGRLAYGRDRFAGIANRVVIEGGVSYDAEDSPVQSLTLEGSAGFTSENRVGSADLRFAGATGTIAYGRTITPATELHDDLAVMADLTSGRNWRTTNAVTFQATLTRLLSLKLSQAVEYRHVPVPGFGRLDTRTSAALVFTFRKIPPQPPQPPRH